MGDVIIMLALQLGALLVIGSPATFLLAARDKSSAFLGWLLLTPAFGAAIYLGMATVLHSLGLDSPTVFFAVLASACLTSVVVTARSMRRATLRRLLFGTALLAGGAAVAVALNAKDLLVVGLDAYFPLTNNDTFAYLGHIDQIRTVGWQDPGIHYPAGYVPVYAQPHMRVPGVIFVADFADILGLGTHAAFFLSQRAAIPIIVLASTGIALVATDSLFASSVCFSVLLLGNFLLHQVLQQFNSSTMGSMVAPVVLALAIWTARDSRTRAEFVAGSAAIGLAMGTLAMTLPEAHPFYLLFLAVVFAYLAVARRQFRRLAEAFIVFILGFFVISSPLILGTLWELAFQYEHAAAGHPGDWVAAPAFVIQASGINLLTSDVFSAYSIYMRLASLTFLAGFGLAFFAFAWWLVKPPAARGIMHSDVFVVFACAGVMLSFQVFLYGFHIGYGLLKLTDYFAFLPSIVVGVGAVLVGRAIDSRRGRALASLVLIVVCAGYMTVTVREKRFQLRNYSEYCQNAPAPADYRLDALGKGAPALVVPDLHGDSLDLFLYVNRWGPNHIWFRKDESYRFSPLQSTGGGEGWMARIPRVAYWKRHATYFADITYVKGRPTSTLVEILPLAGQVRLIPGHGWRDPDGEDPLEERPSDMRRWLAGHGAFVVYGGSSLAGRALEMELGPGPDLRPDNVIEVTVAQRLLATVAVRDLPKRLVLPMPAFSMFELDGEIRITGAAAGQRQVAVSRLRTMATFR